MSRTGMLQRRREVGAGLVMSGLNVLRLLKGGAHGMGLIFYRRLRHSESPFPSAVFPQGCDGLRQRVKSTAFRPVNQSVCQVRHPMRRLA